MRSHGCRIAVAALALCAALPAVPALAGAETLDVPAASQAATPWTSGGVCSASNSFALTDNLNGQATACALGRHEIAYQAVYLQNASAVGGTALAAYPLVRVRGSVGDRTSLLVDLPSAIAESAQNGRGAFPVTRFGYGLSRMLHEDARSATSIFAEVLPPDSAFAPQHAQSKVALGGVTDLALTPRWTLGLNGGIESTERSGFGLLRPSLGISAAFAANERTQFVAGLGSSVVTRHAVPQSYADIAINQRLSRRTRFVVGLGSTFNAVAGAKAHYLASGFSYRR